MVKIYECQYPNCKARTPNPRLMGWTDEFSGRVMFGLVCPKHDRLLGRENLVRLVGLTYSEARAFESRVPV